MCLYHKDGTLRDNSIFVFGSNLAGRHGAGAAKVAAEKYGAVYGVGRGHVGKSYAIPTKDAELNTLPIAAITLYVNAFIAYAKENPDLFFFVTRVGCGLAGYDNSEIAPLFRKAHELTNVSFPIDWKNYIECVEIGDSHGFSR